MKMEQSTNALRRVPPEIRRMIFKYCLKRNVNAKRHTTPSLLAALRAAPGLYDEALEVYYKINIVVLTPMTYEGFCHLKLQTVKMVRRIVVVLRTKDTAENNRGPHFLSWQENWLGFTRLFTYPNSNFALATGVTYLQLFTFVEEPLIYPVVQNAINNMKLLFFDIRFRSLYKVKDEALENQVVVFLKEIFAKEECTKELVLDDGIDQRRRRALKWTSPDYHR